MLFALPARIPWSAPERRGCLRAGPRWGRAQPEPKVYFSPHLAWVGYPECNLSRFVCIGGESCPIVTSQWSLIGLCRGRAGDTRLSAPCEGWSVSIQDEIAARPSNSENAKPGCSCHSYQRVLRIERKRR